MNSTQNCPLHSLDFPKNCIGGLKEGYKFHTEVKCQRCGASWMWGLSWNQDKDFVCPDCSKKCVFDDNPAVDSVYLDEPNQPLCVEHLASLEKQRDMDEQAATGN